MSEVVTGLADPSANVIFGAVIDEQYDGEIHVTIIATGFSQTFEENLLQGKAVVSHQWLGTSCWRTFGLNAVVPCQATHPRQYNIMGE